MFSNIAMKPVRLCLAIWFIFSVLFVSNVFAASTINVQGKLTNKEGNPITGIQDLYFRLYNVSIAATPLWTEQHRINLGNDGLFNVRLGEVASLDTLSFDKQLYLGISINGENEMLPRQVLTSSPYALGSIGDFSVGKKLIVNGNARFSAVSEAWSEGIRIDVARNAWGGIRWYRGDANYNGNWGLGYKNDSTDDLVFTNNNGGIQYDRLVLTKSGNVGIGTVSPIEKLDINGNIKLSGAYGRRLETNRGILAFSHGMGDWNHVIYNNWANLDNEGSWDGMKMNVYDGLNVRVGTQKSSALFVNAGGNVGIGTASPIAKLTIKEPNSRILLGELSPSWGAISMASSGMAGGTYALTSNGSRTYVNGETGGEVGLRINNDTKLLVATNGNVGIGTAAPNAKLDLGATTGKKLLTYWSTNIYQGLGVDIGGGPYESNWFGSAGPSNQGFLSLGFYSNAEPPVYSEKVRIQAGGNVGIGTASPGAKLDVAGDVTIRGNRINLGTDSAQYAWIKVEGTHALGFRFSDRRVVVADGWSKNFMISHPLDPQHKYLLHSTLEGPENGVYYRGEAQLINGKTAVQLPSYFEALTRKEGRTVLLTSKFEADEHISMLAASEIKDGRFGVRMIDEKNPSQKFYWEVKAIRADLTPLEVEIAKEE